MNTSPLAQYKLVIEEGIHTSISELGPSSPLRDACQYALTIGGKRYRPIITLLVAEALNPGAPVLASALAVEFFHTASLVADDLPCMDNDDIRRNHPSTHRKHGEGIALLVSYALIAAGYENLAKNAALLRASAFAHSHNSDRICVLALENATYNTGLLGATGGQFLDVCPPDLSVQTTRQAIHQKTVSLFEIAFVCGWVYGGGALENLTLVKKLASHYGMAFQIADDLDDEAQDAINGRKLNMAAVAGKAAAKTMFHEEIESYRRTLKELRIDTPSLRHLAESLEREI